MVVSHINESYDHLPHLWKLWSPTSVKVVVVSHISEVTFSVQPSEMVHLWHVIPSTVVWSKSELVQALLLLFLVTHFSTENTKETVLSNENETKMTGGLFIVTRAKSWLWWSAFRMVATKSLDYDDQYGRNEKKTKMTCLVASSSWPGGGQGWLTRGWLSLKRDLNIFRSFNQNLL